MPFDMPSTRRATASSSATSSSRRRLSAAPPREPDRVQVDPLLLKPAKPETVPEPQPAPQPQAKPGMAKWPGIVAVVGMGKAPQPVEPAELAAVQALSRSGLAAIPWPFLKTGEHVRIEHGALEGVEGILTAVKKEFRVVLSVTLLQRSVAVEMDRDLIRPIPRRECRSCP